MWPPRFPSFWLHPNFRGAAAAPKNSSQPFHGPSLDSDRAKAASPRTKTGARPTGSARAPNGWLYRRKWFQNQVALCGAQRPFGLLSSFFLSGITPFFPSVALLPSPFIEVLSTTVGAQGGRAQGSRAQGCRAQGSRAQGGRAQGSRAQGGRAQGSRAQGGRAQGGAKIGAAKGEGVLEGGGAGPGGQYGMRNGQDTCQGISFYYISGN